MNALIQQYGVWASSTLCGCCVGGLTLWFFQLVGQARATRESSFEQQRRETIRQGNSIYRWFEPLVDDLARVAFSADDSTTLSRHLQLSAVPLPYRPAEFIGTKAVEGGLLGAGIAVCCGMVGFGTFGLVLGIGITLLYPALARKAVTAQAQLRLKRIRLRLPFVVDQISLMMEAGAGFEESLRTAVGDNVNHPLSRELNEVLRQMSLGRPRDQALYGLRDRLADDDLSELIFAIIKGEELGTPLSSILREQANQMRLKRSQWGEKAAAEAEVQMVFPGMITMVACLLVVVAPLLLPAVMALLEN